MGSLAVLGPSWDPLGTAWMFPQTLHNLDAPTWVLPQSGSSRSFLRQAATRLLETPSAGDLLGDDFAICAQNGGGLGRKERSKDKGIDGCS